MKFQVNSRLLQQRFPFSALNHCWITENLSLDLGHLQLLRDCFKQWQLSDDTLLALLLYLVHQVNQGSLCVELKEPDFLQSLRLMGVATPIDNQQIRQWSQLLLNDKSILVFENDAIFFERYWQMKNMLSKRLRDLLKAYAGSVFTAQQVGSIALEVIDELSFDSIENKQILAVITSLLQPFSIISGGPGTGKTTIMSAVLRGLIKLGYKASDIILAAPTGRAANRMTESLHQVLSQHVKKLSMVDKQLLLISALTIHRLLGSHPYRGGYDHGLHNPLSCKVLVIDEVSMVDVMLMNQLLHAVPSNCRVVFLGDQFQLPSVESGAVLADLMPPLGLENDVSELMYSQLITALTGFSEKEEMISKFSVVAKPQLLTDKVTVLDVSKRSKAHIATISELIKSGESEAVLASEYWRPFHAEALSKTGVFFLPMPKESQNWLSFCQGWIKHHYFVAYPTFKSQLMALQGFDESQLSAYHKQLDAVFETIGSNRILTLTNQSIVGSELINQKVIEMMRRQLGVPGHSTEFHGSVIMVQKNDHSLGIYNGDIGIILKNQGGQFRMVLPAKSGYQSHSVHVVPAFKSAYAMTVHKSQGSEFAHVLMPLLPDGRHRLMTREIIYTGMTRAKESVLICGEQAALKTAIKRQTNRHTGLRFWYN
ncbi:MAG: exodeoxyribonuclease V subunit alpha [Marinicella sp.]|nr:exodeoxyribonuclease V subunit alpha [Xanthomonadales bacterium]